MGEHTKGPWYCDHAGRVWRRPSSELHQNGGEVAGDHPVATAHFGGAHWDNKYPVEANARLIAAAPCLLEALELLVDRLESIRDSSIVLINARSVIAKATQPAKSQEGE